METRQVRQFLVMRVEELGTDITTYRVWEPWDEHKTSTQVVEEDQQRGLVGTRRVPADLAVAPHVANRSFLIRDWFASQYREAYDLVREAYPESDQEDWVSRGLGLLTTIPR